MKGFFRAQRYLSSASALHKFSILGFWNTLKTSGQLILFNKWRNKILWGLPT